MTLNEIIEEMKAKVTDNCGMSLTAEEVKTILAALTSPAVAQENAAGVAAIAATVPPESAIESADLIEETAEPKGKLPDTFPGHAVLSAAGINTYAQLRKQMQSKDGLTAIPGVGDTTAERIEEALKG